MCLSLFQILLWSGFRLPCVLFFLFSPLLAAVATVVLVVHHLLLYPKVSLWECVYTERAEAAVVPRGNSHVTIKQRCNYATWADIQNALKRRRRRRSYSHSFRITYDKSAVSLLESGEYRYI